MALFMGAAFSPLGAVLCLLTSLILYLFYRLLYAPYHVHKKYGIKGPRPEPFWGSYSHIKKMKTNSFLEEGQKKYGSIFGFYIGSKFNVVVCDVEQIEQILINHDDKLSCGGPYMVWSRLIKDSLGVPFGLQSSSDRHQWQSCRAAIAPTLSGLNVRQIIPVVSEGCTTLVQKIAEIAESQVITDIHRLYMKFTMETLIATVFGQWVDIQTGREGGSELMSATNEFISAFLDSMKNRTEEVTVILSHFPLVRPLLVCLAGRLAASQAHRRLQEAGCRLVEARRTHTSPPQDLLQLLLEAELDGTSEKFSDKQIVGFAIDFLMSGHETTASVLSCVSYQLALHNEVQDQVQEEIDGYFKKRPEKSLYAASLRLPYLNSVIEETMRLYPPAQILFRYCEEDIELDRYTIPKGANLCIPIFLVHKNLEHWPQPHRFNPSRFSDDEKMKYHETAYMPFGAGSHKCVGTKFALAQIKMALVAILRHHTFALSPDTKEPQCGNIPQNGVMLHILPRNSTTSDP